MGTHLSAREALEQLGDVCEHDVFDDSGQLLLAKGTQITDALRSQLIERGVTIQCESKPRKASKTDEPAKVSRRIDRRDEPYSRERTARFAKQVASTAEQIDKLGQQILSPSSRVIQAIADASEILGEMLREDADQAIAPIQSGTTATLSERSAYMSMLAINVGLELEYDDDAVARLGHAALLHDVGLFVMPDHMRDETVALDESESWEYRRHPLKTSDILSEFSVVQDEVRVIASQVHERRDGTGYPRGLSGNHIHPLARVLGLIDSYLTLVTNGPGRPAIVPHDAIGLLLREGSRGRFEPDVMRAFLNQISLFPIGSRVALNTGTDATVLRRNGSNYATPVVQQEDGAILSTDSETKIKGPVVDSGRMRIKDDGMELAMFER